MIALIFTAFLLFFAGGGIALMGDRLGTWVGKKRISKFGLRPRETAKLYTFFSGSLIALLVMLLLLWLNNDYLRAIQERKTLKNSIVGLHKENASLGEQNRKAQMQIAAATAEVAQATKDLQEAIAKKAQAESALLAAKKNLTAMQGKLSGTLAKLAASQSAVAARQRDVAAAQTQLSSVNSRLSETTNNLHATMDNLNMTVDDLGHVRAEAKKLNVRNASLRRENEGLTKNNAKLFVQNEALTVKNATLTGRPLIYARGGELGRTTIDATQPLENIRAALGAWLDGLNKRAGSAGAANGPNDRAILLVNPPSQDPNATAVLSSEEEIMNAIVAAISDQRLLQPSVAIVAAAKYNTAGGEQVRVYLRPYHNSLVFHTGQIVTSTTIDGTKDEAAIKQSLYSFLTDSVRRQAIESGVIAEHDPVTGNESATLYDITQVGDIIKEIQSAGANAHVDAVAISDTYSVQPVSLRLVVETNVGNDAVTAAPR